MALYALYLGAMGVTFPSVGHTFHLGSEVSGRLFPADFSGFVVGVLLCGVLSDRVGRKAVLLTGIAAYSAGLALFGSAPSFPMVLGAAALLGAGTGAMETVAAALASDLFPDRRAFILNAIQVAFGGAAAISPSLAHFLMDRGTSWRALYVGLAAFTALLFVSLAFQRVPRTAHAEEAVEVGALLDLLKQRLFLVLCLAMALYVGAEVAFAAWMPTYFTRQIPGGRAWAGFVVTVFWVAMTAGRLLTGALVTRIALLRLTLLMAVGGAIGAALALLPMPPLGVQCFVALTGFCFSGIFGLIIAEAGEQYATRAGTAFGGIVAVGGAGGAVIPWIIGALGDTALGWRGALLLIPFLMVLLSLLLWSLERTVTHSHSR